VIHCVTTKLEGVFVIEVQAHADQRGEFVESYSQRVFKEQGLDFRFVQDNQSISWKPGTIRGLHYQLTPKAQTKLIRVLSGEIYDVVVDIRHGSPTFGQWIGVMLSRSNGKQLLVPKGFAHGFCTMQPNTVLYKVDEFYSQEHDRGIAWNDPDIGIQWPCETPILSEKDSMHPRLKDAVSNFVYEEIRNEISAG
jgi:dTDP-4-dehydrorhamnose 3,5-epimerase